MGSEVREGTWWYKNPAYHGLFNHWSSVVLAAFIIFKDHVQTHEIFKPKEQNSLHQSGAKWMHLNHLLFLHPTHGAKHRNKARKKCAISKSEEIQFCINYIFLSLQKSLIKRTLCLSVYLSDGFLFKHERTLATFFKFSRKKYWEIFITIV